MAATGVRPLIVPLILCPLQCGSRDCPEDKVVGPIKCYNTTKAIIRAAAKQIPSIKAIFNCLIEFYFHFNWSYFTFNEQKDL